MKRVGLIVAIAVVVVGALLVARCRRETSPTGVQSAGGSGRARVASGSAAVDDGLPAWFVVRGAPARRIAGRVTFEGAPVKGAVVTLNYEMIRAGTARPQERVTGADGTFDFGIRAPSFYTVGATAPGRTVEILGINLSDPSLKPPSDQLELRLHGCEASVSGTIADASGGPIPHARVQLGGIVSTTGVDADVHGAYLLCVRRGTAEVEYAADGYAAVVLSIEVYGPMVQDVVLVPEAVITGRVVRADDGHPVEHARVRVFPMEFGADRAMGGLAVSDADGRFRTAGLVPGRYWVTVEADGLTMATGIEALVEVGVISDVVVTLIAVPRLRGVVTRGGKPVAGAWVRAIRKSPVARSTPGTSQADGTFVLERVPAGEVMFSVDKYTVVSPASFQVTGAPEQDGATIEVSELGTIRGRITRLGVPLEGASVSCRVGEGNSQMACGQIGQGNDKMFTGSDGRYEFRGLGGGIHQIAASGDDVGAFAEPVKVTLAAGEERNDVDIELNRAGTIAGVVVDQQGKPVKGVFIQWIDDKTGDLGRSITDAQGRYRCAQLIGGAQYRAGVFPDSTTQTRFPTADGKPYPVIEVKDGTTVIEGIRLAIERQNLTIAGRVVDASGTPVVDAIVRAMPVAEGEPVVFNPWRKLSMTFTDADGGFAITGLPAGMFAIQARSPDGGEGITTGVAAGTTRVRVTLERPGVIAGELVAFPEPPAVMATPLVGTFKLNPGMIDKDSFRVSGVRPGRYLINAQTTYEGDAVLVEVRAGETVRVTLTARGRGAIEGTVRDFKTRAPIADVACHAVMSVDGTVGLTSWDLTSAPKSDARGVVILDPAPAGTVTVTCSNPSMRMSPPSADVVVASGARVTVPLWSVAIGDQPGTVGLEFHWMTTLPRVYNVVPGSAAAAAGLLTGDLVTAVDGAFVDGLNGGGVSFLLGGRAVGTEVTVTVARGAETKTVTMTVKAP